MKATDGTHLGPIDLGIKQPTLKELCESGWQEEGGRMMAILYGGAETVSVIRHPATGTIHHSLGSTFAHDTQCGRWVAGAKTERMAVSELVHMIDGLPVLKAKLCGKCWLEKWFEEAE